MKKSTNQPAENRSRRPRFVPVKYKATPLRRKTKAVLPKGGSYAYEVTKRTLLEVEEMAGLGMMEKHIASCLGISQDTFIQKKKAHPELVEALARGTAKVVREIARGLKINATTGTDREPGGSVAAQKFYLQAKGGYVEEKTPERGRDKPLVIRLELPNINRGPIQKVVDA